MRGKGTRARRAAFSLVALLFFLEGECARAQTPPAWHVISSYGQASAPRSQGFVEFGSLSFASVGPLWAFSPVPAEGSRFNFLDILGGRVHVRLLDGVSLSGGLRRTHVSNLGVVGPDNPGLSFYSGVVGLSWPAR